MWVQRLRRLTCNVDVKHHVYLLTCDDDDSWTRVTEESGSSQLSLSVHTTFHGNGNDSLTQAKNDLHYRYYSWYNARVGHGGNDSLTRNFKKQVRHRCDCGYTQVQERSHVLYIWPPRSDYD